MPARTSNSTSAYRASSEAVTGHPAFKAVAHGRRIFDAAYVCWGVSELWIFGRDRAKVAGRREDRGSLSLLLVAIPAAMAGAFALARFGAGTIAAPPAMMLAAGVTLMLGGIAFRLWAVRSLGRFFRVAVTTQDDHRLIDGGPYHWLRHPSYTGVMATILGFALAIGNWLSLAAAVLPPLAAFAWRIRVEEASLASRFGPSWHAYSARRRALVPFVW